MRGNEGIHRHDISGETRERIKELLPVAKQALSDAGLALSDIDAVAATSRPGLLGSLLVGLTFAKTLAWAAKKPFVAVNHLLGHLYAVQLAEKGAPAREPIPYPYLGLLVSGGHSSICTVSDFDDVEMLGTTVDDAAGEAFDKVASFYGFGYPGGAAIDRLARNGSADAARFPLPNLYKGARRCDVSYSGLKTAAVNQLDQFWNPAYEKTPENIAAAFQEAAVRILARAVFRAAEDTGLRTLVAGGGVAANSRLRSLLAERADIACVFPPLALCTDNGAMIAGLGCRLLERGERSGWDTAAESRVASFRRGARERRGA